MTAPRPCRGFRGKHKGMRVGGVVERKEEKRREELGR